MDIFRTSLFDNEIMKNDIKSDYRVNTQFEFLGIIWIYRCAESACPVFWKSPVRKEEITVPDR